MARTNLTLPEMRKRAKRYDALRARLSRTRDQAEKSIEHLTVAIEGFGTAFLVGISHGRFGGISILGVPLELGAGVLLNLAGFMGAAGKNSHHLHAIGNGALAAYATVLGNDVAQRGGGRAISGRPSTRRRRALGGGTSREIPAAPSEEDADLASYVRSRIAA